MEMITTILNSLPPIALAVVKATIVLGIVQLALAASPRVPAATRHLLLVASLAGFLLFPTFSFFLPAWELPVLPRAEVAAFTSIEDPDFQGARDPAAPNVMTVTAPRLGVMPDLAPAPADPAPPPPAPGSLPWGAIAAYAWMTVALLLLSRLAIGFLRVWWIVRTAEPVSAEIAAAAAEARARLGLDREVRLLASEFVHVPMIGGVGRPVLLLPASAEAWPGDLREVVLLHELGHLKRWDALTLVLTHVVTALYWFHPQVWIASATARRECERACDDLVLTAGTRPSEYAGHLLSMVRLMPEIESLGAVTLGMSRRSQLEGRLLAILHPTVRRGTIDGRAVAIATIAAALVFAPLSAARLTVSGVLPEASVQLASLTPLDQADSDGLQESPEPFEGDHDPGDEPEAWAGEEKTDRDAPRNGREWYERGSRLHRQDRYAEAMTAFGNAAAAGYRTADSLYNIACGYALQNDREQALDWLERSLEAGFDGIAHAREDSDLDPIRTDPRFGALLARFDGEAGSSRKKGDKVTRTADRFASLRQERSTDGEAWSKVGLDLLGLRALDDAVFALERAVENLGYGGATATYNLACAHALRGDEQQALDRLERSIEAGFDDPEKIRRDPDLASLRRSPRWVELVRLADDLSLHAHAGRSDGKTEYSRRKWGPAAAHFENLVQTRPASGRAWYNLGWSLHYSSRFERAIDAFDRARRLDYRAPTSTYNVACGYAMLGRSDEAIDWLERSEQAGFDLHSYMWDDEDLESLHGNPRFDALARRVAEKKRRSEAERKAAKVEQI
ncbi:MAG TPA: M56 family metallopeptidase [Thermoanaerobaculia bacterium]|nr:M56 family metallopeptidase [Thermoanaerobaculia bacterium]